MHEKEGKKLISKSKEQQKQNVKCNKSKKKSKIGSRRETRSKKNEGIYIIQLFYIYDYTVIWEIQIVNNFMVLCFADVELMDVDVQHEDEGKQ